MAREVKIVTWCDSCLEMGKHVEADEHPGLNSAGARVVVDLCDDHFDEYLVSALAVLDTHGRTEGKAPRAARKVTVALGPCPECDREFHSAQALGMHRWRKHGIPSQNKKNAA